MASVTTKSARSLTARSPKRTRAQVTLTTQATVGDLIDIPGMDLDALVQETADLAADDIMEEMETQNAGLAPPKRKVTSPRAADFGQRYFDGQPVKELTRMELLMRDTRALRDERRIDREMARKFWCATALTQRLFPNVSELQVRVDGVGATPRHRGAVDVAVREYTGLARAPRQVRDGVRSAQATGYFLGFLSVTRRDFLPFLNLNFGTRAS